MESQREIERKYNKLLQKVANDDYYKVDLTNRINCYVCQTCGHVTKTKDVDAGCTPMMFNCEKCKSTARSTFFKDIAPNEKHTIEWFRPTLKQVLKMRRNPAMLEHIFNGGLDFRRVE